MFGPIDGTGLDRRNFATMIVLLSPAKDIDMTRCALPRAGTQPGHLEMSQRIIDKLRTYGPGRIARLMGISPKLAALNHQRFQDWSLPFDAGNAKPAAAAFHGEVYKGLDLASLNRSGIDRAQRHVRILSGLYGVLRPLDLIQPYRLEMGCGFSMGRGAKDLYAFWSERITATIAEDLQTTRSATVINLASAEYARSVRFDRLPARVITPVFKDLTPGGYRMLMLFAKRQRGRMCRWIVQHGTAEPERIKAYAEDGYRFATALSGTDEWVFTRDRR